MAKTIVVCGFGTGISTAVAQRFGAEGFQVALVGRSEERLAAGVSALTARGVRAQAFAADLSDEAQIKPLIQSVRSKLGAVTALHWNAYGGGAGDLLTADAQAIRGVFELPVTALILTVQAALAELTSQPEAAVLVTNGGLGLDSAEVDAQAVAWKAMGLAVANAAKHKLVGVLSQQLKQKNVYVGEVIVLGPVKGTAWDDGSAKIEASSVADKFWELYRGRSTVSASVG